MSFEDPQLLTLQIGCLVLGIAVATGGGLLGLRADTERPLQCVPVYLLSIALFLGGMSLLCWYLPIAEEVANRAFPKPTEKAGEETDEPADDATAQLRTHVRSLPC